MKKLHLKITIFDESRDQNEIGCPKTYNTKSQVNEVIINFFKKFKKETELPVSPRTAN